MRKRIAAALACLVIGAMPLVEATPTNALGHQVAPAAPTVGRPTIKFTWGWITGTVYFNRRETRSLRTVTAAAAAAATICATMGAQTLGVACGVSGAAVHQWSYVAANAHSAQKCVKIKLPTMWASAYTGGYCR